ncbi:uncharacterized protein LOC124438807 isoform X2 [Xenia sp. Carnegie-2017]|uniref:uncharacterized protein LOC124438807 isoform X2 n=1 Tax=Xenia sp. Carnegie-2017 TaxID=2897299 RepID=UPI001F037F8F|nr:uncharacterized protein LOC124438807 isoform X2 [Xenia sp. Carnegie-2017]
MEAIIKSALSIVVDVGEGRNGMHFLDAFIDKLKETYDKLKETYDKLKETYDKPENDLRQSFIHFQIGVEELKRIQESTANETSSSTQVTTIKLSQQCQMRFKLAGEKAKKTFENDSSSTEEKIKASKIRIASAILEHSDNCGLATRDFMLCLKDLNSSIFAGIKAKTHNYIVTEVLDIVIDINLALANFIFKHTNKRMSVLKWPQIQYNGQLVHPFYFKKVEQNTTTSLPWYSAHFTKNTDLFNEEMVVNKEGELLIFDGNELQKFNSKTEVFETWCTFQRSDVQNRQVRCMNVDENGVVYVLLGCKDKSNSDYTLLLCLEDKIVQKCSLSFPEVIQVSKIFLAVAPNSNIIIAVATVKKDQNYIMMHVCDSKGNLNKPFVAKGKRKPIDDEMKYLSISSDDNIVILTYKSPKTYRIIISTMDGKFVKKKKFQPHKDEINSYKEVIYTPVSNSVTGFFFDKSKLVIETYSVETEKFNLPIILINTGYDSEIFDASLRIVHHAGENVALVCRKKSVVRFIIGNRSCGDVDSTLKWMNMEVKTDLDSVPGVKKENSSSKANTSSTAFINSEPSEHSDAAEENNCHQDDRKQETSSSNTSTSATTLINSERSDTESAVGLTNKLSTVCNLETTYSEIPNHVQRKLEERLNKGDELLENDWKSLYKVLKFPESKEVMIAEKFSDNPTRYMLKTWFKRDGQHANVKALLLALKECNQGGLAYEIERDLDVKLPHKVQQNTVPLMVQQNTVNDRDVSLSQNNKENSSSKANTSSTAFINSEPSEHSDAAEENNCHQDDRKQETSSSNTSTSATTLINSERSDTVSAFGLTNQSSTVCNLETTYSEIPNHVQRKLEERLNKGKELLENDWKSLYKVLKLPEGKEDMIPEKFSDNPTRYVLKTWFDRDGQHANVKALLLALKECKQGGLALEIERDLDVKLPDKAEQNPVPVEVQQNTVNDRDVSLGQNNKEKEGQNPVSQRKTKVPFGLRELPCDMVERPLLVKDIIKKLKSKSNKVGLVGVRRRDVLSIRGMGGLGKTVLAQAVAWVQAEQRHVIWLDIGQNPDCLTLLNILIQELGGTVTYSNESDAQSWLRENTIDKDCLLVLDDVWNIKHASWFDCLSGKCQLLITTRDADVVCGLKGIEIYELQIMPKDQSRQLLYNCAQVSTDEQSTLSVELQRIVEELLEQCRGLPLALSIIGATLIGAHAEQDWQDTLDELKSANLQLSIRSKEDLLPGEYQYTNVSAAIDVSLKRLSQTNREYEEKFFDLAIFPEDTDIPSDILELFWSSENISGRNSCSGKETRHILRLLEKKSLLQKGPVMEMKNSYRVHDLVLDYAREKLRNEDPSKQRSVEDVQCQFLDALREQCTDREWPRFNGKRNYFFRYLPYHLHSAKQYEELQQLFFNFHWLQEKAKETNLPSLISDFRFLEHPSDEIKLLKSSLMLSADVIESTPNSIGTQLLGRLLSHVEQFPGVKKLLGKAKEISSTTCHLVPLFSCLSDPTGPLIKIFRKHCDKVLALVTTVGPSGLIVISASKDCLIKVHELETGMELEVLRGHTMAVYCLALSHCGTKLASGSYDSTTRLWNLDTYKLLFTMEAEGGFVNALDFSIDDKCLFSGSNDGNLRIWDVANGKLLAKTQAHETNMHIRGLCTTRDGRMIATGSLDYNVKLWDASKLSHLATLKGHTDTVYAVAATYDSKMIVSASGDKTLKIWNLQSFGELRTLKGHQGEIYSVAVSSDSKHIVSGGQDMDVRLWCFRTGKSLFCFKGHSQSIRSVIIISNGRKALTGSQDKTFCLWDLDIKKDKNDNSFRGHCEDVMDIAVTQDGLNCVSSSMDGTIKIWKCIKAEERFTLRGHTKKVINVSISNNGDYVVSLGKDSLIKVWSLIDGKEIRGISGDKQSRLVRFDLDNKLVLIGCKDNQIFLWDWKNDDKAKRLTLPSYTTMEIAFQENMAYTCSRNNEVCKIDLNSLKVTFVSQGPNPSCMKMVVLPKGDAILAGIVTDNVFIYWELSSWREIRYKADHPQDSVITAIDITKDGKFVLTGSSLGTISLVNLGTSKVVQKFNNTESGEGVRLISMLSNDLSFIIVDEANRVELRNFSNSSEKVPLGQPGAKVKCVSPVGLQYILLGCDNGILLFFHHQKNNPTEYLKSAFKESVTQVQGHPNTEYLYFAAGTQCGSVKLWYVEKSTPPKLIEIWSHDQVHQYPITALAFIHGAEDVLCGSYDNFVVHMNSTGVVRTYSYKSYGIAALRVVEENLLVAAYIRGFSVVKWRLKEGEILEMFDGGADREQVSRAYLALEETVSHEQLSGTCIERIVSKGSHHSLLHWELKTGEIIHRMHGHSHNIRALAFIPGGECLLSGSRDKTLKMWNLKNGQLMEEFHFEHDVLAIACAKNGTACVGLQGGQVCFLRIKTLAANAQ